MKTHKWLALMNKQGACVRFVSGIDVSSGQYQQLAHSHKFSDIFSSITTPERVIKIGFYDVYQWSATLSAGNALCECNARKENARMVGEGLTCLVG